MEFVVEMMFLGMSFTESKEYGDRYTVDMFFPGGDAWKFKVKDNDKNKPMIDALHKLKCGDKAECKCRLMTMKDGALYLGLTDVAVE